MIKSKNGVDLSKLNPVMWRAGVVMEDLCSKYKREAVITSGVDGKHGVGSLHGKGKALDFRTFHLPGGYLGLAAQDVYARARAELKPRGFDVILEKDHIHIEFDPKEV